MGPNALVNFLETRPSHKLYDCFGGSASLFLRESFLFPVLLALLEARRLGSDVLNGSLK